MGLVAPIGVAVAVGVPTIGHGLFLFSITPLDLAVAGVVGTAGAVFVEITYRAVGSRRQAQPR